jgi:hypothetical protein
LIAPNPPLPFFGASMCVARHGDLLIVAHPERPPIASEWTAYLTVAETMERELGSLRILVLSRGGVPDSTQRTAYIERIRRSKAAVVSDSIAARATTRYMAVWNRAIRAFGASELEDALCYLGADTGALRPILASFEAWLTPSEEPRPARASQRYTFS